MNPLTWLKIGAAAAILVIGMAGGFKIAQHAYQGTIAKQAATIAADQVQAQSADAALAAQERATAAAMAQAAKDRAQAQVALRGAQANADVAKALQSHYRAKLAAADRLAKTVCHKPILQCDLPASISTSY